MVINSVVFYLLKWSDLLIMILLGYGFNDENNGGWVVYIDFWNSGWKNWWSVYFNCNLFDYKFFLCFCIWEIKCFCYFCVFIILGYVWFKIFNKLWLSNGRYGKYLYYDLI